MTIRILLVDDDALVRTGLRVILGGTPEIEVVGEAADGVAALEAVATLEPEVVLMDIRMPRMDGVAATRDIVRRRRAANRATPAVLVLTTFDTDEAVLAALKAGATGYLLKSTPPDTLVGAIHSAAAGDPVLSPSVTARLIAAITSTGDRRRDDARRQLAALTDREREVALAVGRGLSNADIAGELYLGIPTVKAHVSRVLDKLGVDSRVQVAIVVHDADLDSGSPGSPRS